MDACPIGPIDRADDFKRLLATPQRLRSAHFCVHYLRSRPQVPKRRLPQRQEPELSTDLVTALQKPVDDFDQTAPGAVVRWLGCVVPKRHARRAVTRNLLRRQIRAAVERHAHRLDPGLWLVRLRGPFPVDRFPSASSLALRSAARQELDHLFTEAKR